MVLGTHWKRSGKCGKCTFFFLGDPFRLSLRKGEGRVRVQCHAQFERHMKPLTSVLSPCPGGEADSRYARKTFGMPLESLRSKHFVFMMISNCSRPKTRLRRCDCPKRRKAESGSTIWHAPSQLPLLDRGAEHSLPGNRVTLALLELSGQRPGQMRPRSLSKAWQSHSVFGRTGARMRGFPHLSLAAQSYAEF